MDPAARILLVDPDPTGLDRLRAALPADEYDVCNAPVDTALAVARQKTPELVLLAALHADPGTFDLCRDLKADAGLGRLPVLFITCRADTATLHEAFAAGAADCLPTPFVETELRARVTAHVEKARLQSQLQETRRQLATRGQELEDEVARRQRLTERLAVISGGPTRRWDVADFVGQSDMLQDILKSVARLQGASIPVLITGESGTGKELIARALHFGGTCAEGPFIPVNCSAIPDELAESLFFGHVRGAFTGADSDRSGYFELAHGGSLFLDEVSDMSLDLQSKLLRVLEDSRVHPIGAKTDRQVTVRVLAATNVELQSHVRSGAFREDLYFRLARYPVRVPPLRERRDDIPLLARHFLKSFGDEVGVEVLDLSPEVVQMLQTYDFPGNVRELRSAIERALIESGGERIEPQHVHLGFGPVTAMPRPPSTQPAVAGEEMPLDFAEAEMVLIRRALHLAGGNITEAARLMGINRTKIYRKLAEAGERSTGEADA